MDFLLNPLFIGSGVIALIVIAGITVYFFRKKKIAQNFPASQPNQPTTPVQTEANTQQISTTPIKPNNKRYIAIIAIGASLAVLIPLGVLVLNSKDKQTVVESQQDTQTTTPVCQAITITDTLNKPLSQEQLSLLQPFDEVKIAISASSPQIDKARFRVNGSTWQEVTIKNNSAFIGNYIIPEGTKKFTIEAEVHSPSEGWL